MKAVQYAEHGGPEVLHVVEVDEPHAGPGQARIAVRAAGVNPVDWKIRRGLMRVKLPAIPGSDVAGVIDEAGHGADGVVIGGEGWEVGDEVFGSAVTGGAAQYAVLENFAAKPTGMSFEEAAGLPVVVETAVRVFEQLGIRSGQTLVINAASGGVGVAAVQLARARGIAVIGTASPHNHDFLRQLGATPTTYGEGLPARVAEVAPDGVDFAFDAGGRGALPELIEITGSAERVVTIADYQGAQEHGVRFTSGGGGEARAWHALSEAADLYERGLFSMPVERTFPLEQAAEAHRISEEGHVRGKLVLVVD